MSQPAPNYRTDSLNLAFSLESHLTVSSVLVGPAIVTGLQFLLYGIYLMLFLSCLSVLKRQGLTRASHFHLISLSSLFGLASVSVVLETARILWDATYYFSIMTHNEELMKQLMSQAGKRIQYGFNGTVAVLYLIGNIIADMILIFRCYIIWGHRKPIVIGPIVACTLSNLLGTACTIIIIVKGSATQDAGMGWFQLSHLMMGIYMILNLFITMILISLVAGRIYWISRRSSGVASATSRKRYNTVAAIILESGLIYPLVLIPNVAFNTAEALVGWDLTPLLIQAAGIAPTLIIVRSGKGISIEDHEELGSQQTTEVNLSTCVETYTSSQFQSVN
ncbi:hypothetical protein Moror_8170 [Moniliophthora roreri MCA 2997]|uniref:Uncharacterized protein n=1 Tax=Moniliophthora roreri (strain MCA 2997) TaxID=1381753 RepID=V2XP96_MONRO|nr:hypothetical protein Moror_8170 [Moniliophthora roreri MCA 2997]